MHSRCTRGVTAVEVVIGVSIAALILIYAGQAIALFATTGRTVAERTEATYLAEDGLELLRYLRDGSWNTVSSLSTNATYYVVVSGASIGITTSPQTINGFTRSFTVSNVYRNSTTRDIVASTTGGSVIDAGSRYIAMRVHGGMSSTTVSLTGLFTNIDP